MGWDRHKLLWHGNGTDKYVPRTTLVIYKRVGCLQRQDAVGNAQ